MNREFNPFFSPSSSSSKARKKCSMADIFYGNDEINKDIDIFLGNKKHEKRDYADNDVLSELSKTTKKNRYHHNTKLIVASIIFATDLSLSLSSIPKTVGYFLQTKKDLEEKKRISNVLDDVNSRIVYTLNILSEVDITLELYHRFLSYINQSYLKGTRQASKESRSRPEWARPRPKDTKQSKVIRLFYQQAMDAYDKILISIYEDLGFDFKEEELHDLDAFFDREHSNTIQKVYDMTLGRLIKSKNKQDRLFKYSFERLYYLIVYIEDIHSKILPHLAYMQSYISRIELLIDKTRCNFKTITTYQKPIKKLVFKLLDVVKKHKEFKEELKNNIKHNHTSSKIKRAIERVLTLNI